MSVQLPIDSLSPDQKRYINKSLKIKPKLNFMQKQYFNFSPPPVLAYRIEDGNVMLPFNFAFNLFNMGKKEGKEKVFPNADKEFVQDSFYYFGKPRDDDQKKVLKKASKMLIKQRSCLLALFVGYGKTFCSTHLAHKLKGKTLIVVHRSVLVKQWVYATTQKFAKAKTQILTTNSQMDPAANFYIINIINVPKMGNDFFKDIKTLIVDECHCTPTKSFSKMFFYIQPKYVIGLSGTPERPDGMERLFYKVFGNDLIIRKLNKLHYVYRYSTNFEPEYTLLPNGKTNWNSVLTSLASDQDRNDMIVELIKFFKDRTILVLCKRKEQAKYLKEKLDEEKEDATILIGSKKKYEVTARIIVSTYSKTGTGFDHPSLDMLILATDVMEGIEQYVGRVFRRQDVVPIVLDIVDNFPALKNHFYTRKRWYKEHGGKLYEFEDKFPEFFGEEAADDSSSESEPEVDIQPGMVRLLRNRGSK